MSEVLVRDLDAARRDPVVFAEVVLGKALWPHQVEVVRSGARYRVINAGRRSGKTFTFAVLVLWLMFTKPGARVLLVSAGELAVKRTHDEIAALARGSLGASSVEGDNVMTLTLSNGSRLESVPASLRAVRSADVDLLIVDEAGFVPSEIWQAAEPTIGARPGARVIVTSTPWMGPGHFFHDLWRQGMDRPDVEVEAWHWPSTINPLVDQTWLEGVRERSPADYFGREYLAEWTDASGAYFTDRELQDAVATYALMPPALALERGGGWLDGPGAYPVLPAVAGVDWGFSRDANALVLLAPLEDHGLNEDLPGAGQRVLFVPWLEAHYAMPYSQFIDRVLEVGRAGYRLHAIASETNGVGQYPTQDLASRLFAADGWVVTKPWVSPVWTDARRKMTGFGKLKGMLQRGQLVLPQSPELLKQLRALEFSQSEGGSMRIAVPDRLGHDDLAMALMQAVSCVNPNQLHVDAGEKDRWAPAGDLDSLEVVTTPMGLRVPVEPSPSVEVPWFWHMPAGPESGDGW